jgi:hypothetical protein
MDIPAASAPEFRLVRPHDPAGRLGIYLTVVDGQIIVDFGRTIQWVGLTPAEAEKLSAELLGAVRTARTLHHP